MLVVGHKIWYADGSVYTGPWASAPATGVQVVMLYHSEEYAPGMVYRTYLGGGDRYLLTGSGEYLNTDNSASWVAANYPGAHVLEGSLITDIAFDAIRANAMADRNAP